VLDRLTIGERIASVSALVLLASTFLEWFKLDIPESLGIEYFSDGSGQNAWTSLGLIPVALMVVVGIVLIVAVMRLAGSGSRRAGDALVAVAGAVAAVLILFRMIYPPAGGSFEGAFGQMADADLTVTFGIFVGLAAAVGIAIGGALSLREDRGRK
jgi:hypothetical protein